MVDINKETLKSWWVEWRLFLLFVLLLFSFRSTIADWSHVPTGSMKPTLMEGDRILVDKLAYDLRFPFLHYRLKTWDDPQVGDIVIFPSPENEELYVKRVVGVPGDEVSMRDNRLIVNGKAVNYSRDNAGVANILKPDDKDNFVVLEEELSNGTHNIMISRYFRSAASNFPTQKIPADQYLVLGDNRDSSKDSRFIGFIDRERIRGKATRVIVSLDSENYWLPRDGRYFDELK